MTVASRVLALVVAVGLVLGALAVRNRGEDGTDVGPGTGGGDALTVSCPTEWRALCGDVLPDTDVVTAGADAIAAGLTSGEGTAVLPSAWADVVDDARARAGRDPLVRSDVLATTPLVVVAFADRAAVLADACGVELSALDWACIGEHAGSRWEDLGGDVRWGTVVPGHLAPTSATGLVATAGVIGARTGTPFSLNDLRDVGFSSWFGRVERAVASFRPPGGSHMTAMVTRGPSAANVAMVTEAELATRGLDTAFGSLVVAVPQPLHEVALVAVGTDRGLVEDVADAVSAEALVAAGWRTSDAAPAGSPISDLPPVTPTPSGGVLTAVLDVWDDVAG